jgi:hypothetical protein
MFPRGRHTQGAHLRDRCNLRFLCCLEFRGGGLFIGSILSLDPFCTERRHVFIPPVRSARLGGSCMVGHTTRDSYEA